MREWNVGHPWYIRVTGEIEAAHAALTREQLGALITSHPSKLLSLSTGGGEVSAETGPLGGMTIGTHGVVAELLEGSPILRVRFCEAVRLTLAPTAKFDEASPEYGVSFVDSTEEVFRLLLPGPWHESETQRYVFDPNTRSWAETCGAEPKGVTATWKAGILAVRLGVSEVRFNAATLAATGNTEATVSAGRVTLELRDPGLASVVIAESTHRQSGLFRRLVSNNGGSRFTVSSDLDSPKCIEIVIAVPLSREFIVSFGNVGVTRSGSSATFAGRTGVAHSLTIQPKAERAAPPTPRGFISGVELRPLSENTAELSFSLAGEGGTWLVPDHLAISLGENPSGEAVGAPPSPADETAEDVPVLIRDRRRRITIPVSSDAAGIDLSQELWRGLPERVRALDPDGRAYLGTLVEQDLGTPPIVAAIEDFTYLCRAMVWHCKVAKVAESLSIVGGRASVRAAGKLWLRIAERLPRLRSAPLSIGEFSGWVQAAAWARSLELGAVERWDCALPGFSIRTLTTSPGASGESIAGYLHAADKGDSTPSTPELLFRLTADVNAVARQAPDFKSETSVGTTIGEIKSIVRLTLPLLQLCRFFEIDAQTYDQIHRNPESGIPEKVVCLLCAASTGFARSQPGVFARFADLVHQARGTFSIDLPCCWAGLALLSQMKNSRSFATVSEPTPVAAARAATPAATHVITPAASHMAIPAATHVAASVAPVSTPMAPEVGQKETATTSPEAASQSPNVGEHAFTFRIPAGSGLPKASFLSVVARLNPSGTDVTEVDYALTETLPPKAFTKIKPPNGFSPFFAGGGNLFANLATKGADIRAFLAGLGVEVAVGHYFAGLTGAGLHNRQAHSMLLSSLDPAVARLIDNDLSGEYAS